MENNGRKSGFFFTAMALIMLSFMLFTVQIWVRTFEQSDQRHAQRFKGEAVRLVLSSLSDESLSDFANASAFYATYKLANYSSNAGAGLAMAASSDPKNPHTGAVEAALASLIKNGTTSLIPPLNYSNEEKEAYTLEAWKEKVRAASSLMGFNVSFSDAYNFNISQIDAWTVEVAFDMDMNISDFEGTVWQSKRLKAKSNFSIVGMPDPMVHRNDMLRREVAFDSAASKQIFRHSAYRVPSDLAPRNIANGTRGFGWFYGAIRTEYPTIENGGYEEPLSQLVLVHKWDENLSTYASLYGAVIVTNLPEYVEENYTEGACEYTKRTETKCLNCVVRYFPKQPGCSKSPEMNNKTNNTYLAIDGSGWISKLAEVNRAGMRSERYVLIDNPKEKAEDAIDDPDYHYLWDISAIRDAAICGFYVETPLAPSFFQRMLAATGVSSAPGTIKSDYGIESFVVGKWAGGADDSGNGGEHQKLTKLDWTFYSSDLPKPESLAPRIKGMMGCKSKEMCQSSAPNNEGVGFFRLRNEDVSRYGLDKIACNVDARIPRMAPCS